MDLKLQKKLASKISNKSPKKIRINMERLDDIKEAITKADVRSLISDGAIGVGSKVGVSRYRAKARAAQRRKNKQRGAGRKKGKKGARQDKKEVWMDKVRCQRALIRSLKDKLDVKVFRNLLLKVKGGYFRSVRHIKIYLTEHKLVRGRDK